MARATTQVLRVKDLREKCELLLSAVVADKLATAAEVAASQPGSPGNRANDIGAWFSFYTRLIEWRARGSGVRVSGLSREQAEELTQRTLSREPAVVALSPAADGAPRSLAVHPKSFNALVHIDVRDRLLQYLSEAAERRIRAGSGSLEDVSALARVLDEIAAQHALVAWCICHPEPGLPFPAGTVRPVVPAEYSGLNPLEIVLLMRAHRQVNAERLAALQQLVTPDDKAGSQRPSWSTFFASVADAKEVDAALLMNDWSLTGLLASNALAASNAREQMKRAEKAA